ncbi:MAG: hypothetical protein IJ068_07140 [Bacilli bacterium]|nr:hypothetical protein [Bacilli bacterium]
MKKGLFVGSFNPITLSHQNIASDLLKENICDYIYFLPVNSKKDDLIGIQERINLINLVINSKEEVLNVYNYSESGFFNYDVLKKIDGITHIIMGSDLFLRFNTFKNYKDILNEYFIIVIDRNFDTKEYINKYYKDYLDKIIVIDKKYDGSSKLAKDDLKKGNNKYLDLKVLDYIKTNNLYN